MPKFSLTILYVDNLTASALFYSQLLGQEPAEASPSFAMFAMPSGAGLGLWSRHSVTPAALGGGGATEIAFMADDVDATYENWVARGLTMAQTPENLDFGRTFVALDPDGHRVRIFSPA